MHSIGPVNVCSYVCLFVCSKSRKAPLPIAELSQCLPPAIPATVFPSPARHVLVRLLSLCVVELDIGIGDGVIGPLQRPGALWENVCALCSMASDVLLHSDGGILQPSGLGAPESAAAAEFVQVVEDEKWALRHALASLWARVLPSTCGISDIGVSLDSGVCARLY